MDDYTGRRIADVGREIYETAGIVRHVTGRKKNAKLETIRAPRHFAYFRVTRRLRARSQSLKSQTLWGKKDTENLYYTRVCHIYVYECVYVLSGTRKRTTGAVVR